MSRELRDNKPRERNHWSTGVFDDFIARMLEVKRILHLSVRGISMLPETTVFVEKWEKYRRSTTGRPERPGRSVDDRRAEAQLAKSERERGFPVLYSHATVAIWGHLEAFVEDLATSHLLNVANATEGEPFRSVKITVQDLNRLERRELMQHVVREAMRSLKADLKTGVEQFDGILAAIGMGGPVDNEVRENLHELCSIRNVIVHRSGVVDRKLKDRCPGGKYGVGDQVVVTAADFSRYDGAIHAFIFELLVRGLVADGHSREQAVKLLRTADGSESSGSP
jgi:hypothetical protein